MNLEEALRVWEERLAHFERALASCADAEQKFAIQKNIEECKENIKRLQSGQIKNETGSRRADPRSEGQK